jgi:hypothetical protein
MLMVHEIKAMHKELEKENEEKEFAIVSQTNEFLFNFKSINQITSFSSLLNQM